MINQPRENEPLSSRPTQRAASVMVKANKWLPARVAQDGVQPDIIYPHGLQQLRGLFVGAAI